MRIAIGIPTRGRATILAGTLRILTQQSRRPDRLIVCHVSQDDISDCEGIADAAFITAEAGLPRQRNALIEAAADCDVLLFLDDDFLCAPDYVAVTEAAFALHPDIVVTTGTVIADGAKGPGYTLAEGLALLAADRPPRDRLAMAPHFNGYGCNMALRVATLRAHGIRADERLPLYAWYEDIDLTRRLARHGRIVRLAGARGVHLGVKSGRVKQIRLGYSQVINPLYLAHKGTFPWHHALPSIARHCLINLLRALCPEPWVDRRGRLRGNVIALGDLLRGRIAPERILEL